METEEEVSQLVRTRSKWSLLQPGEPVCFCVFLTAEGKVIGDLEICIGDDDQLPTYFDIRLNCNYQGRGLATEACSAALEFFFAGVGVRRVIAYCSVRNAPACRLLARLGFRKEGEFLKERLVKGEWITTVSFAMLAEEYEGRQRGSESAPPRTVSPPTVQEKPRVS